MNKPERITNVRAMEAMVRCINNEDIVESWLMCGVADGDINSDTTDEDLECYIDDDTYRSLLDLFVRLMAQARSNGGLYSDGIVTKAGN